MSRAAFLVEMPGFNQPPTHRQEANLTITHQNTLEVLSQLLDNAEQRRSQSKDMSLHLISTFPAASSPAIATVASSLGPRVTLKHSIYRDAYTEPASSYIMRSCQTGSRTIVNYNELPEMTVDEFTDAVAQTFAKCDGDGVVKAVGDQAGSTTDGADYWFHFEGRIPEVTLSCIRFLRSAYPGARVSVEVEKPGREGLEDLARQADVVFYSRSWACARGFRDAEACVREQARTTHAPVSVCTWGEEQAALWDSSGESLYTNDAVRVPTEEVVDTIGAGDTFIAGMLFGLVNRQDEKVDYQSVLSFATLLAGLKVQRDGFGGLGEDVFRELRPDEVEKLFRDLLDLKA